ncbi:hypothetical protein ACTMUQ_41430 [Streptomyces sp. SD11]|uniref:hypothetical protein n=1 Tax=Streptomyces sp. SD11 TaxID=3452209 RepID=UPI003F8B9336
MVGGLDDVVVVPVPNEAGLPEPRRPTPSVRRPTAAQARGGVAPGSSPENAHHCSTAASPPRRPRSSTLPEHAEDTVRDILAVAAADPWGFRQFDTDDDESEDIRYATVRQLSVTYWVNRPLRRLTGPNIVWLR